MCSLCVFLSMVNVQSLSALTKFVLRDLNVTVGILEAWATSRISYAMFTGCTMNWKSHSGTAEGKIKTHVLQG
jgi:hypothetical protein